MELFTAPFRAFCACRELPNHYQYTWGGDGTENHAEKAFTEPLYNYFTGLGVKNTVCRVAKHDNFQNHHTRSAPKITIRVVRQ